ncbi:sensor histidine kinase [Glaciecola sp. 1036]|uniref:sensor histidine kinase n=1 Tax=Alteromonadaceae TaxID=72275 RepID=UPI003CFC9FA1
MYFLTAVLLDLSAQETVAREHEQSLILDNEQTIYHLNSAIQTTGFFPIPEEIQAPAMFEYASSVKNSVLSKKPKTELSTRPDFSKSTRYGMLVTLNNQTNNQDWRVHVSHYMVNDIQIYTRSGPHLAHTAIIPNESQSPSYSVNMLGRSSPIQISSGESAELIIVLKEVKTRNPLYIGLMTEQKYQSWTRDMDFVFIIAIGIVLGFVMLALTSFLLTFDQTFLWFALSTSFLLTISLLRSPFAVFVIEGQAGIPYWLWLVVGGMQLTILLFVYSFFSPEKSSKTGRVYQLVILLVVMSMLGSLFVDANTNGSIFSISSLLVIILVITTSIVKAYSHGALNLIFMLGWIPLLYSIATTIHLQYSVPEPNQITLQYGNLMSPYFQVLHFFIHFVVLVLRVLEIKREKIAAETASDAKTSFLAQLSHDLKQPLDAMGLTLAHLKDNNKDKDNELLINNAQNIQKNMQDTFSALLDLGQLQTGKIKPVKSLVKLNKLIDELATTHSANFDNKNLKFKLYSQDVTIETDKTLLQRILNNLIHNALKFTENGGVLVSCRARKAGILIQVWDTGCGITDEQQKRIWSILKQSSKRLHTNSPEQALIQQLGHGIGLSSVQYLCSLMGYAISFSSEQGKGSVFNLHIPLLTSPSNRPAQTKKPNEAKKQVNIFCAIDDVKLAQALQGYLDQWSYPYQPISLGHNDCFSVDDTEKRLILIEAEDIEDLRNKIRDLKIQKPENLNSNLVLACFCITNENLKSTIQIGTFKDILLLANPIKPAQLRSLLNFIEIK